MNSVLDNEKVVSDAAYLAARRRKKAISYVIKTLIMLVLILWAAVAVFPFVWVLLSSFKDRFEVVAEPLKFNFSTFSNVNYQKIWSGSLNIFTAYLNSFYISGLVVLGTVLVSLLAAFVLARFSFRGIKAIEALVVACMMFPAFSLLFPIIKIVSALGLYGYQLGVVLPQIALNLGFTTLLLTGFLKSIPIDIEEAAYIDGAKTMRVLFTVIVPMAKSALVTAMIFVFIWSYNDLFLQMIIITDERRFPISLLLNKLASKESGFDYGKMAAAVTLVSFPILGVYIVLQKHIIKGLTAGAVKG